MKSKIKKTTTIQTNNTGTAQHDTPDDFDHEREYDDCEYFPEY